MKISGDFAIVAVAAIVMAAAVAETGFLLHADEDGTKGCGNAQSAAAPKEFSAAAPPAAGGPAFPSQKIIGLEGQQQAAAPSRPQNPAP